MEQGAQAGPGWRDLLWKEAINAACQILDTKAGPLFLQDHCPAGVVERLSPRAGCIPSRTFLSENISSCSLWRSALRPNSRWPIHPGREIVGQVTLVPAAGWWQELEFTYEMSLEVSLF
jgi:hypothetical protein